MPRNQEQINKLSDKQKASGQKPKDACPDSTGIETMCTANTDKTETP